ncbi:amidohydrolase family protein [Aporhodopirellula aestuarii]|uniref:Amidohydrolase n=1 Tax=Aporhodopirellula aestuarii TaxID=2950107 RepID=A0ABT0U4U4_9BACT|nr:amidohydrolase family protein [Aporhodopirellula aestuarii]MCM2371468.1 amidohydrolase [Aporhodopirellula aestuarii]
MTPFCFPDVKNRTLADSKSNLQVLLAWTLGVLLCTATVAQGTTPTNVTPAPGASTADATNPDQSSQDAAAPESDLPSVEKNGDAQQILDGCDGRELSVRKFNPIPQLKVASTPLTHARFPVVDVHTHIFYRLRHNEEALDDLVAMMDRNRIAVCASLDGKLGSQLDEHLEHLWSRYRDRFVVYANVDWQGDGATDDPATWACHRKGFAERTAEKLRIAVSRGVSGLKIFKRLGLGYRNPDGSLIKIDDPRWDPIWEVCGELEIPVIIHTADPAAFFEPIDSSNERWEELSRHPDWSFHGDEYPSRDELLQARNRVIARHPNTQFIGAHIANNSEDLQTVSMWMERYPNLWLEPASRISELGRQPYTSRDFIIRYADRILFGTDGPWPEKRLNLYWRFFETRDEYFPYSEKSPPPQGLWQIYGIHLPDEVLRKIYFENASRLIPGVKWRIEKFRELAQ